MSEKHKDPFYPFPVIYHEISPDPKTGNSRWMGYHDNWTDSEIHYVEWRDGRWISITGSIYDGVYDNNSRHTERECSPNERAAFPAEPYTAEYYTKDGQLFCPYGHKASYNYPYPGCSDYDCVFLRHRQHHYTETFYEKDAVPMKIIVDGVEFSRRK